jgi:hypothetical protein
VDLDADIARVVTLRDGKTVKLDGYNHPGAAVSESSTSSTTTRPSRSSGYGVVIAGDGSRSRTRGLVVTA